MISSLTVVYTIALPSAKDNVLSCLEVSKYGETGDQLFTDTSLYKVDELFFDVTLTVILDKKFPI